MKNLCQAALGAVLATTAVAGSAAELEVTPYRPTVSNPAALPAPGFLEAELGWARERDRREGTRTTSLPYLLKYALSEDVGILAGGDVYLSQHDASGTRTSGVGDTSLTLKLRHGIDEDSALGLEAGVRLPTAKDALGSGKSDYVVNTIFSTGIGAYDADFNLGLTRRGAKDADEGRAELSWAAAVARPLGGRWGAALEISGAARRGQRASAELLGALTYQVSKAVVLDAGLARGLNEGVRWRAFAGVSVLFSGR